MSLSIAVEPLERSPGSFKGFLELVFRSDNADFSYAGETTEGGRKLMEYHYRVPLEASHYGLPVRRIGGNHSV